VRVIAADGDHPVQFVDGSSAIVVATRGAEPIAAGGYRAVLLLDGERMLARESLRVAEDCLRWWANAAALAAPGAPVVLVGVGGALASAMSTWRLAAVAAAELVDRRELRFPPAVRVATVTGSAENVARALEPVRRVEGVDVLGPVEVTGGRGGLGDGVDVRAIVRFDYADGAAVASALRSEIVRVAQSRRKRAAGPRPAPPTLKVRCDDVEPFGSEAGR
jgi:primosomal protein N' (replication factor Y)